MPKLEVANIMLALGGDAGNTVPKYRITAAEVAVLRLIHGNESVTDIEPVGHEERTHRQELTRLTDRYGRNIEGRTQAPAVMQLFPGAAARVFERFEELDDIPAEYYKAETRVSSTAPDKPRQTAKPLDPVEQQPDPAAVAGAATEADAASAASSEAQQQGAEDGAQQGNQTPAEPADGVEDIQDEHTDKDVLS